MTAEKQYSSNVLNWIFFFLSFPLAMSGIAWLSKNGLTQQNWMESVGPMIWLILPLYFYNEIMKNGEGYTKVTVTKNKLWKCRVSGTDEIFYVRGDTEQEVELFFETTLEGKQVFIEEANIKLFGFDMEIPKENNEH